MGIVLIIGMSAFALALEEYPSPTEDIFAMGSGGEMRGITAPTMGAVVSKRTGIGMTLMIQDHVFRHRPIGEGVGETMYADIMAFDAYASIAFLCPAQEGPAGIRSARLIDHGPQPFGERHSLCRRFAQWYGVVDVSRSAQPLRMAPTIAVETRMIGASRDQATRLGCSFLPDDNISMDIAMSPPPCVMRHAVATGHEKIGTRRNRTGACHKGNLLTKVIDVIPGLALCQKSKLTNGDQPLPGL